MAIPTLNELHKMQHELTGLEDDAARARLVAGQLRKCGDYKSILEWHRSRSGSYSSHDFNGITKLLEDAMAEFGPTILEILARRQELISHESMTLACLKRAELGSFVSLESTPAD